MTIFDLETSALPDAQLELVKPEFKPAANLRDPDKIKASIAEKESAWRERAALDAKTAQILAIGLLDEDHGTRILTGPEPAMLEVLWECWMQGERLVGFACKHFDMPMAWQRSVILGVKLPKDLMSGRYWNPRVIDLQEVWCCFGRDVTGQNLDVICRALGIGKKFGNGADFGRLFVEDRERALEYLQNDLAITAALAARLGIV